MSSKDDGYIVVETVGTFVPFVLLVISILSLVNIITLQVRIHYALTQAAGTISMYCYTLEAMGFSDEIMSMNRQASAFSDNIDGVLGGINTLAGGGGGWSDISNAYDSVQDMAGDPKKMIQSFANYSLQELRNTASAVLMEPLIYRYLSNRNQSADEYLKRLRVVSFQIVDCVIVDINENVKLTAMYEVEYTFGALRIPFTPTLRISQTVVTKAWLGGSGYGYLGGG